MNYGQNSRNPFETSNAVGQQPPVQPQQQQQQRGPREYQTTPGDYGYTETITLDEADTNAKPRVQSGEQPDLIEEVLTNKDLLVSKGFYFIFFAAFGSLFPLMGVYFKQLGMNSIQAGILIGIRPIIEFVSAPFWSSMADKFKKGKAMLLASLVCWIIFTWSMSYIRPPAAACVIFNATHHVLYTAYSDETDENYEVSVTERRRGRRSIVYVEEEEGNYAGDGIRLEEVLEPLTARVVPGLLLKRERRSLEQIEDFNPQLSFQRKGSMPVVRTKKSREDEEDDGSYHHKHPPGHITGKSPISIEYTLNYNKDVHATYVSPPFSTVVYKWEEVETVFFLMLLLVLLGEFFSAPAITLADSCTLNYLKDNIDNYGRQRMFGSVGWGISMFFVGMALDNSTEFEWHPCGPHERERNYRTCFSVFVVLMALALLVATRFKFNYEGEEYQEDIQMRPVEVIPGPRPIFNTAPPINPPPGMYQEKKFEFLDKWKSAVFAQRTKELPEWMEVIKHFGSLRYGAFLFATWFMGVGIGLVFTFLFWHLQDLGGTPTLFGMASVVNHISEIIAYMYSLEFIKKFGHTKVLCIGLVCNVVRFLYISWLENPWWVLPFEFIQGVTHATVWAACCSYLTQASPPHLKTSTQGVLQGLHHGLGKGAGAVVGGIFINKYGTPATFAAYGLVSLLILAGFVFMNYRKTSSGFQWFEDEGEHNVVFDEGSGIAPHGVPSAPITKSASKHNITGGTHTGGMDGQSQVNNYSSADGMLAPQSQGGYNGGNWTQYSKQAESNERIDMSLKDKILNYGSISPDLTITDYEKIGDHFKDISEFIYDLQQRDEVSEKDGATPRPELTMFCQQPVTTESGYDW